MAVMRTRSVNWLEKAFMTPKYKRSIWPLIFCTGLNGAFIVLGFYNRSVPAIVIQTGVLVRNSLVP